MRRRGALALAAVLWLAAMPANAQQQVSDTLQPEAASGIGDKALVRAERQMVAAANPLAAEAGLAVLRDGGSAADALVAIQAVLGLVEPQSSGLGGGAFLVWYDAATREVLTWDGRETAPAAADGDLFVRADGKPMDFMAAVVGGRAVGTPGVVRLLESIHGHAGRLPWKGLFDGARRLATDGFTVSPRLATLVAGDAALAAEPTTRDYFYPGGRPLAAGDTLRNPAYAETLARLAEGGAAAFYAGVIADGIIEAVSGHATNPGLLTTTDLESYASKKRAPVCSSYRGLDVCGMGPPSSGALTIGQILGMVEGFDLKGLGPDDPESWRILGDATQLAFADRGRFMADADFVRLPEGLLDPAYLKNRAAAIRRPTALPADAVKPGEPPWKKAEHRRDGIETERAGTTHVVVVDQAGNVASMTSTIETAFGAHLMTGGFLLNNQLTDFSFVPAGENGEPVANRVQPGKRPRSSMAPTIVLDRGKPLHALGSPGGSTIIPYVAKTLVALIDWDMDMQRAVALPHLVNRFGPYQIEAGTAAVELAPDLRALGFMVEETDLTSGLQGVTINAGGLEGGADPRREGVALGN